MGPVAADIELRSWINAPARGYRSRPTLGDLNRQVVEEQGTRPRISKPSSRPRLPNEIARDRSETKSIPRARRRGTLSTFEPVVFSSLREKLKVIGKNNRAARTRRNCVCGVKRARATDR